MRFELLSELGRGSTGIVYKAIDCETRDTVAVKELLPGAKAPQHELLFARKITHPNVCRVHDLYREGGRVFISMEFIDGQCLKGPLPAAEALQIAKQICGGLDAAHQQGIVHGDLKPANILITRGGIVKITDFGLAQSIDPDATAGGAISGTPEYMAPELFLGERADIRSDIYALGKVLKKLGLEGPVISRCLEREPGKRYASAIELRDALDRPEPLFRPVPKMVHGFLVSSLALAVTAVVFFGWSHSESVPKVQSAGILQSAGIPLKPAVAVLFDEDALTPALVRDGKLRVVEGGELDKVFAELKLNRGEAFDAATAQRVGKLVGAKYLLIGGRQALGDQVRVNARLIRTETGEVVAAETMTGREENPMEMVRQLTERVEN